MKINIYYNIYVKELTQATLRHASDSSLSALTLKSKTRLFPERGFGACEKVSGPNARASLTAY